MEHLSYDEQDILTQLSTGWNYQLPFPLRDHHGAAAPGGLHAYDVTKTIFPPPLPRRVIQDHLVSQWLSRRSHTLSRLGRTFHESRSTLIRRFPRFLCSTRRKLSSFRISDCVLINSSPALWQALTSRLHRPRLGITQHLPPDGLHVQPWRSSRAPGITRPYGTAR
jgi:hypothetical protein